jgi:hypothetical protein
LSRSGTRRHGSTEQATGIVKLPLRQMLAPKHDETVRTEQSADLGLRMGRERTR